MNFSVPAISPRTVSTRTVARLIVIIVAAILFIVFNASVRSERAPLQHEFDSWLQLTRETIATSTETAPPVTISLSSERPELVADWRISLAEGGDVAELLRILDLAREANIFSKTASRESQPLRLSVTDGSREFVAALSPSDIAGDVAMGNLIRLFKLYAIERPRSAARVAKVNDRDSAPDQEAQNPSVE